MQQQSRREHCSGSVLPGRSARVTEWSVYQENLIVLKFLDNCTKIIAAWKKRVVHKGETPYPNPSVSRQYFVIQFQQRAQNNIMINE